MPRKEKVKQSPRSSRGLGYLSVMFLVAAALMIGAAHEPLKELLDTFANIDESPVVNPHEPETVLAPDTPELEKPQQLESVILSKTNLTVLKVTIADSIRIEYRLEPASIGVDSSHRQAVLTIACALRYGGPVRRAVVFIGVGKYIDSAGRPALRSRAETKLSALRVNRMVCSPETTERDIEWGRIAEYDIRFAIPRGFKVDL